MPSGIDYSLTALSESETADEAARMLSCSKRVGWRQVGPCDGAGLGERDGGSISRQGRSLAIFYRRC
jgi:hypothetical protein